MAVSTATAADFGDDTAARAVAAAAAAARRSISGRQHTAHSSHIIRQVNTVPCSAGSCSDSSLGSGYKQLVRTAWACHASAQTLSCVPKAQNQHHAAHTPQLICVRAPTPSALHPLPPTPYPPLLTLFFRRPFAAPVPIQPAPGSLAATLVELCPQALVVSAGALPAALCCANALPCVITSNMLEAAECGTVLR